MQTDFTHVKEFEVKIGGEVFEHMLCHVVLPYSNWEWVTVCHSESMPALKRGVPRIMVKVKITLKTRKVTYEGNEHTNWRSNKIFIHKKPDTHDLFPAQDR